MYKKNNETFQNMLYLQTPATHNFVFQWQRSPTDSTASKMCLWPKIYACCRTNLCKTL